VIDNLLIGHEAPAAAFEFTRSVNVPGITVSVGEMVASLARVAGSEVAARISWEVDPLVARLVASWPRGFDAARGKSLGMSADASFDDIVRAYIDYTKGVL
jgi:hypothetical protein